MSKERTIYIFLGPPGSGKGSLSQLCVKRLGWNQLSTGNLCRQHIALETEIGKEIDFIIKSGKLISDRLIICMVEDWLRTSFNEHGMVILDGFPRTVAQAIALRELLQMPDFADVNLNIVQMVISEQSIIDRLATRSICQNNKCQAVYSLNSNSTLQPRVSMTCDECSSALVKRLDDEGDAIRERLQIHNKHEKELLDFYNEVGQQVISLEVEQPLETVYEELLSLISHS